MVLQRPKKTEIPATAPPATREGRSDDKMSESERAFWQAHETLMGLEGQTSTDPEDVHMVHAFGTPREWRTMSNVPRGVIHMLAGIHARGKYTGSRFRTQLVEDFFLMMRSAEGYGSEQMVRVASARSGGGMEQPRKGGLFSGWFGRGDQPR